MDAYNDNKTHTIVVMSSAQVGKTELINNIVGYAVDQNPGPMLLLQPTLEMAQTWSKDRLAPMLRDTPCLRGKVKDPRSRDSGNTMLHKPLALNTKIPTPTGWTTMGALSVGDKVIGADGKKTIVTHVTPVLINRECYELEFSDGQKVVCDADHPWPIEYWAVDKKNKNPKQKIISRILSTKEISKNFKLKNRFKYSIRNCKPIEYSKKNLPIDPYVLGIWLGDGFSHSSKIACDNIDIDYINNRIINSGHDTRVEFNDGRCPVINIDINTYREKDGTTGQFVSSNTGLRSSLKILGLISKAGDGKSRKKIPDDYLLSSINQRINLLQGLMDSDGSCRPNDGLCIFTNINETLANNVDILVKSLGLRSVIRTIDNPICTTNGAVGKKAYRVEFTPPKKLRVFGLDRKYCNQRDTVTTRSTRRRIINVKKVDSVPVKCISVDNKDHLFLCTESFIATHNTFPGGHITMAGANSPASLASRPIRDVLCDEVDRYPASAGAEGDPVNLAKKRTTTFWNRKLILTSTPTIKGVSRIERAYEESDQRRYYVPCPHCDEYNYLKWSQIQWPDGDTSKAGHVCESCGGIAEEKHKSKMLQRGEWRAESVSNGIAGFHLNELYSPWRRWAEVVDDFLLAKKNPETLKTFVNTSLGETWEESGEQVDDDVLFNRRESYTVPDEVQVLTCGVDVQDDRIEAEVVGWREGQESWGIEYRVIYGDPAQKEVWDHLDQFLQKTYQNENGDVLKISSTCIDTGGHHTQITYDFIKPRQLRRIFAVKGVGGAGRPIVSSPSHKRTGQNKRPVDLFTIGTDDAKGLIYSRLKLIEPGPGYCHFPMTYDQEFFAQLTAEKIVTKYRKGFPYKEWVKTRPRNEALDNRVYSLAALIILNPVWSSFKPKKHIEKQVEINEKDQYKPLKRPRQRRGGFVNRWKY